MVLVVTCVAILIAKLSLNYVLRKDIKRLQKFGLEPSTYYTGNNNPENSQSYKSSSVSSDIEVHNEMKTSNDIMNLKVRLNDLEFIAKIETYLEGKRNTNFPFELRRELENLKLQTQTSILKTTNELKGDI